MERKDRDFGNDVEGFTPVRRRLSTINSRHLPQDEKEWTASRCNRLLRALKSRVAILSRDLARVQCAEKAHEVRGEVSFGKTRKAPPDEDWTQVRKKVKRTYSTRGGRGSDSRGAQKGPRARDSRNFIPGEVSIPTPILNRVRGDIASFTCSAGPSVVMKDEDMRPGKRTKAKDGTSDLQISGSLRDIRKQTPTNRYTIYEGIYNGLEALFKATIPEEVELRRKGPKSLLSICLSNVPTYISLEEKVSESHMEQTGSKTAINGRDVSTEIYDDLEAFGSNGRGWKHLRSIVRSHGIQVIGDAIRSGLLEGEIIGLLVTLCIHSKATKEAEVLISSFLSAAQFPEPKGIFTRLSDEPATRSLWLLWKFAETTGNYSFQYRQLTALLAGGILPLGWLGTKELGPVWTKVIQTVALDGSDVDALSFLDTALSLLAKSREMACKCYGTVGAGHAMLETIQQTFSSLLTTLLSIVLLSKHTTVQVHPQDILSHRFSYEHFVTLIRSCLVQWQLSRITNIQGILLTVASTALCGFGNKGFDSEEKQTENLLDCLWKMSGSGELSSMCHEAVSFICNIARCCGRGAASSGFEHLESLHQTLEGFVAGRDSESVTVLKVILADSALAFAQEAPDQKHIDYATAMDGKVHRTTKRKGNSTPGKGLDSFDIGFRWEEGISEWVAATPSIVASKCKDTTSLSEGDFLDWEIPFRRPFRRILTKQSSLHARARLIRPISPTGAPNSNTIYSPQDDTASRLEVIIGSLDDDHAIARDSEVEDIGDNVSVAELASDIEESGDELASESVDVDQTSDVEEPLILHQLSSSTGDHDEAGDESASKGREEQLDEFEGAMSRRQSSSPVSDISNTSEDSEGSSIDDSFTSLDSSAMSLQNSQYGSSRRHIDRVPRLSRRVLRRSLQWQLFDEESDDELSFISVSSENDSSLQDITNSVGPISQRHRHIRVAPKARKASAGFSASLDSEDELGI